MKNGTADYANTKKEVEKLVNEVILPSLKEKYEGKDKKATERVNTILFLYAVSRMSALESLIRLVLIDLVGKDNFDEIKNYFKEEK